MSSIQLENLSGPFSIDKPVDRVTDRMGDSSKRQGTTFGDLLNDSLKEVNSHQIQADQAIKNVISGRDKNLHSAMIAMEKADASLKLMMQVRNKVLEAYKEIMRMQV